MVLVSAMYPKELAASFDQTCYRQKHIPLVKERWGPMGLEDVQLVRGVGTPDGSPAPYQVIALLSFRSLQHFQDAVGAHAEEILGDVPNFTSVQPVIHQ